MVRPVPAEQRVGRPDRGRYSLLPQFFPDQIRELAALPGLLGTPQTFQGRRLRIDGVREVRINTQTLIEPNDRFLAEALGQQLLPFLIGGGDVRDVRFDLGDQYGFALDSEQRARELPGDLERR